MARVMSLATYAEACAAVRDVRKAGELYDQLAPWHAQIPTAPQVASLGAVALYLGMLATVLDRFDDAEAHFIEAMEINERMQAPYWIARTQLEHARMLLARSRPDDTSRATAFLDQVETTAAQYGFAALARHASDLRI